MRFFLLILTLITSSAFAREYNGEKILDYLPIGTYSGDNCTVNVINHTGTVVSVFVSSEDSNADFNSLALTQEEIYESSKKSEYKASFILVPDDSYTGRRNFSIQIQKQKSKVFVSVEEKRRFLGFWTSVRNANCTVVL